MTQSTKKTQQFTLWLESSDQTNQMIIKDTGIYNPALDYVMTLS